MARDPGRPADDMHRRMARMLHALVTHPRTGRTIGQLMAAADLDPANQSDVRKTRRDVKALRTHPDLLLPLGPCLDGYGECIATHPALGPVERARGALQFTVDGQGRTLLALDLTGRDQFVTGRGGYGSRNPLR